MMKPSPEYITMPVLCPEADKDEMCYILREAQETDYTDDRPSTLNRKSPPVVKQPRHQVV